LLNRSAGNFAALATVYSLVQSIRLVTWRSAEALAKADGINLKMIVICE